MAFEAWRTGPFVGREDSLRTFVPCFCSAAELDRVLACRCEAACHESVLEVVEDADRLAALDVLEAKGNTNPLDASAEVDAKSVSDAIVAPGAKAVPGGKAAVDGMAAPGVSNVPGAKAVAAESEPPVA